MMREQFAGILSDNDGTISPKEMFELARAQKIRRLKIEDPAKRPNHGAFLNDLHLAGVVFFLLFLQEISHDRQRLCVIDRRFHFLDDAASQRSRSSSASNQIT